MYMCACTRSHTHSHLRCFSIVCVEHTEFTGHLQFHGMQSSPLYVFTSFSSNKEKSYCLLTLILPWLAPVDATLFPLLKCPSQPLRHHYPHSTVHRISLLGSDSSPLSTCTPSTLLSSGLPHLATMTPWHLTPVFLGHT